MANLRRILLVLLLIAVLGTISWLVLRPHDSEPTYKGRPLNYWLGTYGPGNSFATQTNAVEAVRQIGANAIPALLRRFNAHDSRFKLTLIRLAQKQHHINLNLRTAEQKHSDALFGFMALASNGKSAVPDLLQIYNQRRPGPYDDPVTIAQILANMGPAASNAVPRLVQDTTETNYLIRSAAVWTLGAIHSNPALTVPALTASLRDPADSIRGTAARGLGNFGSDAQSAVPELILALTDIGPFTRNNAAKALKLIDPAAAAQAGVK